MTTLRISLPYNNPETREVLIDEQDRHLLDRYEWHVVDDPDFRYQVMAIDGDFGIDLHRLLMGLERLDSRTVDHLNGDGLDYRRENLEVVTFPELRRRNRQRARNLHREHKEVKTSRYRGVSWDRNRQSWRASIRVNGKQEYLGLWYSEEGAAEAFDERAREVGRRTLNFPEKR